MTEPDLAGFSARVQRLSGVQDQRVLRAFATVPRHRFLRHVVLSRVGAFDVPAGGPLSAEVHRLVYEEDEALVTRLADGVPSSSSTQPSLMARMLEALALEPGHRVLEIGVGTGYNAALIATITGEPVVSVDVQPDVVAEARAALVDAGFPYVSPVVGDGYEGEPAGGPYDRVIVTCGIGGFSPLWLTQVTPGARFVAPVYHGGYHPTFTAHLVAGGSVAGYPVIGSDFMVASGRLHPGYARQPALEARVEPAVHPYPFEELDWPDYRDLWFSAAVREPRIAYRPVADLDDAGPCGLADPDGLVLIQRDALRDLGAQPATVEQAWELVLGWEDAGRPRMEHHRCEFGLVDGVLRPVSWAFA